MKKFRQSVGWICSVAMARRSRDLRASAWRSPDLDPIEQAFAKFKIILRKLL
jgi:hypothetical protein